MTLKQRLEILKEKQARAWQAGDRKEAMRITDRIKEVRFAMSLEQTGVVFVKDALRAECSTNTYGVTKSYRE